MPKKAQVRAIWGWERVREVLTLALAAKPPAEDVTARLVPRCSAAPAACPGCSWHPPRVIRDGDTHTFPSPNTPSDCGESGSQPHLPSVQGSRLVQEEQHLLSFAMVKMSENSQMGITLVHGLKWHSRPQFFSRSCTGGILFQHRPLTLYSQAQERANKPSPSCSWCLSCPSGVLLFAFWPGPVSQCTTEEEGQAPAEFSVLKFSSALIYSWDTHSPQQIPAGVRTRTILSLASPTTQTGSTSNSQGQEQDYNTALDFVQELPHHFHFPPNTIKSPCGLQFLRRDTV